MLVIWAVENKDWVTFNKFPTFQLQQKIPSVLMEDPLARFYKSHKIGEFENQTQLYSLATNQNTFFSENNIFEESIDGKTTQLSKSVQIKSLGKAFKFECKVPHF